MLVPPAEALWEQLLPHLGANCGLWGPLWCLGVTATGATFPWGARPAKYSKGTEVSENSPCSCQELSSHKPCPFLCLFAFRVQISEVFP